MATTGVALNEFVEGVLGPAGRDWLKESILRDPMFSLCLLTEFDALRCPAGALARILVDGDEGFFRSVFLSSQRDETDPALIAEAEAYTQDERDTYAAISRMSYADLDVHVIAAWARHVALSCRFQRP